MFKAEEGGSLNSKYCLTLTQDTLPPSLIVSYNYVLSLGVAACATVRVNNSLCDIT